TIAWVTVKGICSWRLGVERSEDAQQIPVGPVVAVDERPEGDDGGIDVRIGPEAVRIVAHGFADRGPFGRVFITFGGAGKIPEPAGFGVVAEPGELALSTSERGQFALFWVGIEAGGHGVPALVGLEMNSGVQPVAPAEDGVAGEII